MFQHPRPQVGEAAVLGHDEARPRVTLLHIQGSDGNGSANLANRERGGDREGNAVEAHTGAAEGAAVITCSNMSVVNLGGKAGGGGGVALPLS